MIKSWTSWGIGAIAALLLFGAVLSGDGDLGLGTEHVYVNQGNVVVFLYHTFLPGDTVPEENTSIISNAEKFERDIVTLLDMGYKPVSLSNMYLNKTDGESKYFAITLDDGYLTNYEIVFPILQKYGVYADIFINTDNEYMSHHFSFEQARKMEASGLVAIHSHFPAHVDVTLYDVAEFSGELLRSLDTLTQNLGPRKHFFFAYPYGSFNQATRDAAASAGVDLQFVQDREPGDGPFIIRTNVSFEADMARLVETSHFN